MFYYRDGYLFRLNDNSIVGWLSNNGYLMLDYIDGKKYLVHRVIFQIIHGWCPDLVDHIDQNKLNNLVENLRPSNKRMNAMNSKIREDNTSGVRGVSFSKSNQKWFAYLWVNGQRINGGYFNSLEEAVDARSFLERKFI
jgi:hypothetical protein